jgi:hypothetical protein
MNELLLYFTSRLMALAAAVAFGAVAVETLLRPYVLQQLGAAHWGVTVIGYANSRPAIVGLLAAGVYLVRKVTWKIKNVHLMRQEGLAEFPDSVTARGAKHLKALSEMVASGARAAMVYFVQRGDARAFTLAHDIDPAYARAFHEATASGVEALAVASDVSLEGLALPRAIPLQSPLKPD